MQALKDNIEEFETDRNILRGSLEAAQRKAILMSGHYDADYAPRLHAIDDYSTEGSSAPQVIDVLEKLNLRHLAQLYEGDFRGRSGTLDADARPLDFIWFDCGGAEEYHDFVQEYWPLVNENHGMLVLHYTYWAVPVQPGNFDAVRMLPSPLLNEARKQQLGAGLAGNFEILSLLEPNKRHQGSVSMFRKLPLTSRCRREDYQDELENIFGKRPDPLTRL